MTGKQEMGFNGDLKFLARICKGNKSDGMTDKQEVGFIGGKIKRFEN